MSVLFDCLPTLSLLLPLRPLPAQSVTSTEALTKKTNVTKAVDKPKKVGVR